MEIQRGISLKDYTWWKIGGPAEQFCLPRTIADLREAVQVAKREGWPLTILGGGSNVLVGDEGIAGLVVCLRHFRGVEVEERDGRLVMAALAGSLKAELTREFLKRRLAPALFLCGVPGDVGGGVVMNAGVGETLRPREFNEIVDWVEVLRDDRILRFNRDELTWTYRHSAGWQPGVVTTVGVSWPLDPDGEIPMKVKLATRERLKRQPLDLPSCGSTFKNPPGGKAGALIEGAGLKGYRVGDAQISMKHANFIVNLGAATAADVKAIIGHVKTTVLARSGFTLETEVKFLGR